MPQMLKQMGVLRAIALGFAFVPEILLVATGGVPKLVLMAEFAEDTAEAALEKARVARDSLHGFKLKAKIERNEIQAEKFWKIRREEFCAFAKRTRADCMRLRSLTTSWCIRNHHPTFLPELNEILKNRHFIHTIAGHIGDGNFHIIPLVNMSDPKARADMLDVMPKVYELVAKYHGSNTGEHNDGIIRTPYLPHMFKPEVIELFARIKHIFDPLGVLIPAKRLERRFKISRN